VSATIAAMIRPFQAMGARAGTLKCSKELSIPTITPERASRMTIGNISRARFTVSSVSSGDSSNPGAISCMIGSVNSMKRSVSRLSASRMRKNRLDATWNASRLRPFSSSSVKTGTKAPWSAESAKNARTRLGTWKAMVNADMAPETPK
jgi:hypothetical protein